MSKSSSTPSTSADTSRHGMWRNQWTFILAATGGAIGLGNIWRFPYIAGEHGGGAFILAYLMSIVIIGLPIMISEITLGRASRHSPVTAMKMAIKQLDASKFWMLIGWGSIITGLLIFSYYAVIAGWTLNYAVEYASQALNPKVTASTESRWEAFLASPGKLILFQTIFIIITVITLGGGVKKGLERLIVWCMPLLFILMLVLLAYSAWQGDFAKGAAYMFRVDFSKLGVDGVLAALGQAFFSLSLGMGAVMAYGAYVPANVSIIKAALTITFLDTLVAIIAGLIIFPLVFANGLELGGGPGLLFITLASVFDAIPAGAWFGAIFFTLTALSALTSLIALAEPTTAWLVESYNAKRLRVAISLGVFCWILGLGTVLSFNVWSDLYFLGSMTFFDLMDTLAVNFLLPSGGFLIAIFAGWVLSDDIIHQQLGLNKVGLHIWRWMTRIIAPAGVLLVFGHALYNLFQA